MSESVWRNSSNGSTELRPIGGIFFNFFLNHYVHTLVTDNRFSVGAMLHLNFDRKRGAEEAIAATIIVALMEGQWRKNKKNERQQMR
jgi:hypothetical protein